MIDYADTLLSAIGIVLEFICLSLSVVFDVLHWGETNSAVMAEGCISDCHRVCHISIRLAVDAARGGRQDYTT
ncbi:hypothetical protein KIN20_032228 [Parelaphostrongylus tenuis]|uniref:Uncharacterized protein n=1 Tax=Parelaphostrongylus tenuis TaxID=148309 RepID=A0AAD5R6A6_PARTN|nr:hypothetical protein KIN20_032228 [Parelaphostrongylus tenuis]